MVSPSYIFDVTADVFAERVIQESEKSSVLVVYWSPRVSRSLMLVPRMIRLTSQCNGRFRLALFNVDASGPPAPGLPEKRLPTVEVYRHGRAIDVLDDEDDSETALRAFIARHVRVRGAHRLYAEAVRAYGVDDAERGMQLATEAALMEPDDVQTPTDVVKLLVLAGRFEQAEQLLHALPETVREDAEIRNLMAHLNFIRVSLHAPSIGALENTVTVDPWNLDARYQLAASKVVNNDFEGAMQQLLEIARRNPGFRDNAGRNGLLALFHMLGEEDARVRRYRPLLQESMN